MQTNTAYKQKGSTLVEVLVALAVFLIVMGTLVAGYLSAKKLVVKQKEYVYFEAVCLDIAKYGDLYGKNWDEKYFETFLVKDADNNGGTAYFDAKFNRCTAENGKYRLTYVYNETGELVLSIENTISNYFVIQNLNYGNGRYPTAAVETEATL